MNFETQLLQFMGAPKYRPMKQHELAKALHVHSKGQRAELRNELHTLADAGKIVRLRQNRWALPDLGKQAVGIIRMLQKGGAILVPEQEGVQEVYLSDRNCGIALPDDKVAVELLKKEYTERRRGRMQTEDLRPEGKVVRVIERNTTEVVGLLRCTPYYNYVIPDGQRMKHEVRVTDSAKGLENIPENHKVVVKLNEWKDPYQPLTGKLVEDLGEMSEPGMDVSSLLRAAGINEEFPPEVIREADKVSSKITARDLEGRRDLRDAVTFTIDPETARDYDDAVSIEPHPDGGWSLGVHIADVAHFVKPGTLIDKEALRRGNSIYLVDRVVMMLPRELTTKVCSLNPENDHLSHSVQLHLSENGKVISYETFPSVIHSKARMTYTQVQKFMDGDADHGIPEPVVQRLENLCPLARKIRAARIEHGSVDINTPEIEIKLNDQGKVEKMMPRSESKEAYQLIEECMLLANCAVAEILIASNQPAIYRIHEEPDMEQWAAMGMELQALGIDKLPMTRHEINEAIKLAEGTAVEYTANLAILRNFKRAEYAPEQTGHFGLAFDDYTHFTSPIRRYPDLVVHRLLKAVELGRDVPMSGDQITEIAKHCTETEKKADELERQSTETKRIEYYKELLWNQGDGKFKGYIVSVKNKGMIVELPDSLQRGMVTFASMPEEWYGTNEDHTQVITRSRKVKYTLGDEVEVQLAKVDPARGFVDFILANRVPRSPRKKRVKPDLKTGRPRRGSSRRRRS
ncbi:MAG: ribonuclease R [Kiritimatiellales bacterium]|nr:ribonuclease R [Kiritimatiellales bacterium]